MKSMQRKSKRSSAGSVRRISTGPQTSRGSLPMSSPEDDDAALLSLVGGKVAQAYLVEPADLEVAVEVGHVRGQILAAAKDEGVGVRELARRMKISASAVSRQLRSEADMRFSTAILLARALGRRWRFLLSPSAEISDAGGEGQTPTPTSPRAVPPWQCIWTERRRPDRPHRAARTSEGIWRSDAARHQSRLHREGHYSQTEQQRLNLSAARTK
jgi:transcriptional regulator with XRE-family HTH domain